MSRHRPSCFIFKKDGSIESGNIARAIAFAIEQPADVTVNEMIIRPALQER